ncbi:glycoside hydrolase family 31 [Pedobacter yonginense]|uniref:Glycoside hydrolase family 31 n=1 Tax=Pedobacter yonginense TaxID=651869 RepID=A0A317EIX0_9SPHI|nr:TIM-barrel domain-containing protein [Pedobacter yonginense]PWS26514.1 glycoside hydrolase family 31 [Pedobacter yonginense]
MKFTRFKTFFICILFSQTVWSQESVGEIVEYKKTNHGIEGSTLKHYFKISVYNPNCIRLQVSGKKNIEDFSFALVSEKMPDFSNFKILDNANVLTISTDKIVAEIQKKPYFKITYKNNRGEIINEDLDGKALGTTFQGDKVTVYKKHFGERFVGMGESLGNLDRSKSIVTTWNTDYYKYDDAKVPMYISVPFYIGILKDKVYGIYYDNTHKGTFNFGASNKRFMSVSFDGGDMDYFFIHDSSVAKVIENYTALTGRMPLPPKWSIGYQQSRCSYYNESQVNFIANTFREKKIPLDGIVLDADYLVDYEPFRIDTKKFPDMKKMASQLKLKGIELTASVNPGIKIDSSYGAYQNGIKEDVFLKYQDGEKYIADIYPNTNHFPDFTYPKARNWWADQMKVYQEVGINGYWNDMNEPAIDGQMMPDNVVFNYNGRISNTAESHNLYGFLMARASFESFKKYGGNKRPFVMTRSAFAGVQRYSTVWSGDNQAKDEHLLLGVLLNNQMSLSGIPFVGPDLGGYTGDGNKDLYKRWIEVGVFSPYLRNHREQFAAANEPWAYGEENELISQSYINFRYQLMPYLYSKFQETSQNGMPIAKALCLDYPFNEKTYDLNYQYQFLFGDALFIAPVTGKEKQKKVYFPDDVFYNLFTDEKIEGNQEKVIDLDAYHLPIFAKQSSIIPLQSVTQSTKEKPDDVLFVHIYNGSKRNTFAYYEDDGETLNYEKGSFYKRNIEFNPDKRSITFSKKQGEFKSNFTKIKIIMHGFNDVTTALKSKKEHCKPFDPLANLDQIYYDALALKNMRISNQIKESQTFVVDNKNEEIIINY